ncbi:MAG: folate family ECF transporter S component, partial [Acholeplasmatales bacterium]|nr:folate family ECF transporter S component [Acholeplasmatales bacterium]
KGSSKKVDFSLLNTSKAYKNIKIDYVDDHYEISGSQKDYTSANMAKKLFTYMLNEDSFNNVSKTIVKNDNINVMNIFLISLSISFVVVTIVFILLYLFYKKFYNLDIEYDNQILYRTPFYISYWKNQLYWLHDVKKMTLLAMLFSLEIALKLIHLPSGFSNLGIGFSYLVFSIIGMLFGPTTNLIIGCLSDFIGYAISPSPYGFFLPYTLNAMLAGFIYGICFYKTNVSYTKCLLSRLFVNLFVNVFLGSIWWGILTGLDSSGIKDYALLISLPKNLVYLLPQSILQFITLNALKNPLLSLDLIDLKVKESFRFI